MIQNPQEIINEKHKKVINDFCSLDKSKDITELCFDTIKATNSLIDYISESNALISPSKKSIHETNVFTCLENCVNFLNQEIISLNQSLPLLVAFLPLHRASLNMLLSQPNFTISEFDSAWINFQKEFAFTTQSLYPLPIKNVIVEFSHSIEAIKGGAHMTRELQALSKFQQSCETEQKSEDFEQMINDLYKFRKSVLSPNGAEPTEEHKRFYSPQLYSSYKLFEDTLINGYFFLKLKESVQQITNSSKYIQPTQDHDTIMNYLMITFKLFLVLIRHLSSTDLKNEKDEEWLFQIYEILLKMTNNLQIQNNTEFLEQWKAFQKLTNTSLISFDSSQEEQCLELIKLCAQSYPINYPRMTRDVDQIQQLYHLSCTSTKNMYTIHELYYLLGKCIEKSTNPDFTDSVMRFRRSLSKRVVFVNFYSLIDTLEPLVHIIKEKTPKNPTTSQLINMLLDATNKIPKLDFIKEDKDHFVETYKFYLNFINHLSKLPNSQQIVEQMLTYHPSVEILSKYVKFSEQNERILRDTINERSTLFVQNVRMQACTFGSLPWLEKANAFLQYSQGRSREILLIIQNISAVLSFFKLVSSLKQRFPLLSPGSPEEGQSTEKQQDLVDMLTPRTFANKETSVILSILENMSKILPAYNQDEQFQMSDIMIPLVLYSLYSNFLTDDKQLEDSLNQVFQRLYVPRFQDSLLQCYSTINYLNKVRLKYPQAMGKSIDEMCSLFFSMIDGTFPEINLIKQTVNNLIDASGKVSDSLKSEMSVCYSKIRKFISLCFTFYQVYENVSNLTHKRKCACVEIMRMCTEVNQLLSIKTQIENCKQMGIILPDKEEAVNTLIENINKCLASTNIIQSYQMSTQSFYKNLIEQFKQLGTILRIDFLYYAFKREIPSLKKLIQNCSQLSELNLDKTLSVILDHLASFALIGNKSILYDVEEIMTKDTNELLAQISKSSTDSILEVAIFKKQFKFFLNKITPVRSILDLQEYPPAVHQTEYNKIISDLNVSFHNALNNPENADIVPKLSVLSKDIERFVEPSFTNLLYLINKLTPQAIAQAQLEETKKYKEKVSKELQRIQTLIANFDEDQKKKIESSQREIEMFTKAMTEAQTKQQQGAEEISQLREEKEALEKEREHLMSMQKGAGQLHFDNEMSSVISLLLKEDESLSENGLTNQPLSEADFVADQLQEALRTNLRLKKSLQVLSFPHEDAVFSPAEFAEITAKFTEPAVKTTPFAPQRGNESAQLRQTLKDLHAERDGLLRQIVALSSKQKAPKQHKTDLLFKKMQLHSKNVAETTRKSQKEQFLEFAETSDQFFLEVSSEIKELQEEIKRLQNKEPVQEIDEDAQRRALIQKLESQCYPETNE